MNADTFGSVRGGVHRGGFSAKLLGDCRRFTLCATAPLKVIA